MPVILSENVEIFIDSSTLAHRKYENIPRHKNKKHKTLKQKYKKLLQLAKLMEFFPISPYVIPLVFLSFHSIDILSKLALSDGLQVMNVMKCG